MELFGENYLKVRNESIIPLIGFGIKVGKVPYWSFKDILTNNIISFNKISKSTFEIEIKKDDFYKALHCDIELFINKTIVQYTDVLKSKAGSPCWSYVTLYYFSFFASTTLLRFLRRGFIFLNSEHIQRFIDFSYAVNSAPIVLDSGNYYFNFKEENASGNVILILTAKGESVHKLSWIQLENTFREFIPNCDKDEKTIYKSILALFSAFKTEFPSTLRNKLNYTSDSSMIDLEGRIPFIDISDTSDNFAKGLLSISHNATDINQIHATAYIATFLFKFVLKLYEDYSERCKYGKDFVKLRQEYLKIKGSSLPTS